MVRSLAGEKRHGRRSDSTPLPHYIVATCACARPVPESVPEQMRNGAQSRRARSLGSDGRSDEASVVSDVARRAGAHLGMDNRSSSIFDVEKPTDMGEQCFEELVDLGRREHWIVEPYHLCVMESNPLGSGTFGTVLRGTFYGAPVAIKMPKSDKKQHLPLLNELRTLRRLRHPNIVLFLGAHVMPYTDDMALVFELIEGSTLHDWIKAQPHPIVCDEGKLSILHDVTLALRYLHQQDKTLVHGDLKGSNVFVVKGACQPRAKLGDFGLARFLYKTEHMMGGSLRWMAPEIATGTNRAPSCATDIFSLGALISFTLTDQRPFDGIEREQILKTMKRGRLPRLAWPPATSELVKQLRAVGDWCYSQDCEQRPDVMQVLEVLTRCERFLEIQLGRSSVELS